MAIGLCQFKVKRGPTYRARSFRRVRRVIAWLTEGRPRSLCSCLAKIHGAAVCSTLIALAVGLATACRACGPASALPGPASQPGLGLSFPCPSLRDPLAQYLLEL